MRTPLHPPTRLSCPLSCRKAITKSGLPHLAPPPPAPGALCGESERQIRSTVDWSVSSGQGVGGEVLCLGHGAAGGRGQKCKRERLGEELLGPPVYVHDPV